MSQLHSIFLVALLCGVVGANATGAVKVIGYDLAVLGNAGLDSLEKWKLESSAR